MIGNSLVVEGVPGNPHHPHHHALAARSHPLHSFSAIHHLNPNSVSSASHLMSASTFPEPSFLKAAAAAANGSLLQTPTEFVRPLPVVATRYNGVTNSLNGSIHAKSRLSNKYPDPDPQGPVNLVHQFKETSMSDSVHASYSIYSSPRLYPPPGPSSYPHFPPPSPSIQSGPYGSLYPSSPFTPMLQRDTRSTHLLQLQQYPDSNTPILKSPPTSNAPVMTSAVKNVFEPPVVPIVMSEANNRGEKRPFKVPSGKEGSLKHRLLSRPETRVQKKVSSLRNGLGASLPPPAASHLTHSNGVMPNVTSPTECTPPHPPIVTATSSSTVTTNHKNSNTPNGNSGALLHNFSKGSLIQLANGDLRKIEDMQTEDFLSSAEKSSTMRIDPSTVVRIYETANKKGIATLTLSYGEQRHQVDYETAVEHPYFVFQHGWSSCAPEKTLRKFGLRCRQLQVGDVCVSLSPKLNQNGSTSNSRKSSAQKSDSTTSAAGKVRQGHHGQHGGHAPLQNGHLASNGIGMEVNTSGTGITTFAFKKNDLRINCNDNNGLHFNKANGDSNIDSCSNLNNYASVNGNNFSVNLINRHEDEAKRHHEKLENDSNNNSNNMSDKYGGGAPSKKKRRWSAPDQITDENSPLSSPQSMSSVLSSASSVGSGAALSSKNL